MRISTAGFVTSKRVPWNRTGLATSSRLTQFHCIYRPYLLHLLEVQTSSLIIYYLSAPFRCPNVHEVYNPCPPACPTDDCSQATPTGRCPIIGRIGIVVPCKPDCRCKKNYWRKDGICVPYARCNRRNTSSIASMWTSINVNKHSD